jgi:hypothetical protein
LGGDCGGWTGSKVHLESRGKSWQEEEEEDKSWMMPISCPHLVTEFPNNNNNIVVVYYHRQLYIYIYEEIYPDKYQFRVGSGSGSSWSLVLSSKPSLRSSFLLF